MRKSNEYRASLVLAAGLAGSALLSGCVVREQVYQGSRHDPHRDAHEDAAYGRYVDEQHLEYREYNSLKPQNEHRYWDWRGHHTWLS